MVWILKHVKFGGALLKVFVRGLLSCNAEVKITLDTELSPLRSPTTPEIEYVNLYPHW